jgi:predicted HTH transcriptional regulator
LWVNFPFSKEIVARTAGLPEEKTPEKILAVLTDHPELSLAEVAAQIGKSASGVERAAAKLVNSGRLRRIGPAKGGHWEVSP